MSCIHFVISPLSVEAKVLFSSYSFTSMHPQCLVDAWKWQFFGGIHLFKHFCSIIAICFTQNFFHNCCFYNLHNITKHNMRPWKMFFVLWIPLFFCFCVLDFSAVYNYACFSVPFCSTCMHTRILNICILCIMRQIFIIWDVIIFHQEKKIFLYKSRYQGMRWFDVQFLLERWKENKFYFAIYMQLCYDLVFLF